MLPSPMAFLRFLFLLAVFVCLPIVTAAQQPVPARIRQPIDEAKLTVLKGNTYPLARVEFDRGPAASDLPLNRMLLVLKRSPQQEAALEALLDAQQDKSSPNYHGWLTPEEFGKQFGPADQDIQAITSWLSGHGFQVSRISKGRLIIEFSGNAGQLQASFHTAIHKYTVNGEDHWANSSDPQIPAALAPVVAGIDSLNNFPRRPMSELVGTFSRNKVTGKITLVKPAFTFPYQNTELYALGPYDFSTIYNVASLWTSGLNGSGQRIGIVAETDINPQDFSDFHAIFGQTSPAPVLNVIHDGPDPGVTGDEPEADIDTQWSSGIAPGATVDFVVDESTETTAGVDLSAEYIVDNNLDPVMSESYGLCELGLGTTGNTYRSELWEQAAAQGITVLVASGDGGSAVCDVGEKYAQNGLSVSGFASTPYNVSVGGTDFNDLGDFSTYWSATNNPTTGASAISYIPEMTWNDSCTNSETFSFFGATTAEEVCNNYAAQSDGLLTVVGGSGGQSNCTAPTGQTATSCAGGYTKPAWQKGTGVPSDGRRDVPDVSLFASNGFNGSFYIVCQSDAVSSNSCSLNSPYLGYSFQGYGGTSVSSPAFAGIMTLVNQKYGRQGNANYVLYGLASQAGVFHDIPLGSTIAMPCGNATPDCTVNPSGDIYGVLSGYSTTTGYDLATGLGSVNVTNLVNAWPSANFIGTTTTLTIPSAAITHSTSVSFSGNVTPKSGTAVPTGFVALIAETGTSQSGEVNAGNFVLATGSCSGSPCATFSGSTNLLPGGTNYNLIAHYPGDSTFGASDSPPTLMAVNPENSETNLAIVTFNSTTNAITSSNATSFPYGSPYLLRSNVTNSSGANCVNSTTRALAYGCPTGSVTITDNGTALGPGTFPLNIEGYTEYQTIQLTGGSHNLAASYSGDKSFNPSSGSDAVTVTTAPTTTTVVALSGPAYIGSAYPFGVQTQSNSTGVAPTANYTVFDGTTPLATTISSSSPVSPQPGVVEVVASLQVTLSAPSGQHSLTVHYNGDSNYASSVSAPSTVVALYRTTVSGTANPNPVEYPGTMTVTATVSTGNPGSNASLKPTGTITMNTSVAGTQITPVSTTASLDSHGNWVLLGTATFVPQQTDTVVVNYSGDSNYGPSTAYVPITVNVPGFTISSNPSSLAMIAGQTGQATITITPLTTYTSTVALSCQELALWGETCSVSPSSVTLTNGAAATATVNVGTLAPSNSATAAIRRTRRGAIFSLPPPRDMCFGFGTITGAVALFLLALPSPRQRRQSLRRVPWFATTCILCLLAACGGGSNSGGGGGGGGGDSGPFPTATKLSASSTKIVAGASSILTATVSAQDTVTGLISFNSPSGETLFGNVNLVNGSAQTTINNPTPVGVGTFVVLAQYSGDANNLPSQSGNLSIVVTGSGVQYVMGQTATVTQETGVTLTLQ